MRRYRHGSSEGAALIHRESAIRPEVKQRVSDILDQIRTQGDEALRRLTHELDGVDLEDPWLSASAWSSACARVPEALKRALDANHERIRAFHALQLPSDEMFEPVAGLHLGRMHIALSRAACYVPGGRASYPSTVLMTVTLARLAGVDDIFVVTPPADASADSAAGRGFDAVCYAARIAGATRILLAGGAQAIGAAAYGTDSVPACDVIVGPGNAYVTAAKQAVQDRVRIDGPAGPSELLVVADAHASADAIAWDLAAQAEHDPDAQVLLVTSDAGLADRVEEALGAVIESAPRRSIMESSVADHGAIVITNDLNDSITFANAYAPEHLSLFVEEAHTALLSIRCAGSIFVGPSTPVSLGDYGSGTNHVLPTMGHARTRSGLSVMDFMRTQTWQEATSEALRQIASDITIVADAEGLHGHADAVRRRLTGRGETA